MGASVDLEAARTLADASAPTGGVAARAGRRRHELEFLPAALEITETPASPAGRVIMAVIAAFFAIAMVWAWFGMVDIVATAGGKIIPSGRVKVIQPFEIAVIRAIHVEEGETVRAGDLLVELDPTETAADRERLTGELMAVRVEIARLRAQLAGAKAAGQAFTAPAGADPSLVETQRALLDARLDEHARQLAYLDAELDRRMADYMAIEATVAKLDAAIPLIRERKEGLEYLAERKLVAKPRYLAVKQELVEQQAERSVQAHRLDEALSSVAAVLHQRDQAVAEFRRAALAELANATARERGLALELTKAQSRAERQQLLAPTDGVIQQLAVHTIGGVVTPAQQLMVVVPVARRLEIEALVANKDIGFVAEGQAVEIKVETFPFTKYGIIDGEVLHLSRDAIADENLGPVYAARVSMARATMEVGGNTVNLAPGMAVTVEIKTGQRKVIEFLLSPLLRYRDESLRER